MRLLLVEDHPMAMRTLVRLLGDREVVCATSATEAGEVLLAADESSLFGCLIDVGLPEGPRAGIELVRSIREIFPTLPCAFVTGTRDVDLDMEAAQLRALVVPKPASKETLAWALARFDSASPEAIVRAAKRKYDFTEREEQIVAWFVEGGDRASFLVHAGISPSTFRDHRTSILTKAGDATLEMLAKRLLREALGV